MINKKLLSFDRGALRYVGLNVLFQWLGMLCNVVLVMTVSRLIGGVFAGTLTSTALWQGMVRLHKNNKAGNPYKHYIFCRTSFFRLRSYKDNLPKQIGQAPSKQNNVPHRRRYLIPTGKQGTPLFFYPHVTQ